MVQNGIKHITSAPYHPATNGLAERSEQIVKRGLKKIKVGPMTDRLAKILFNYRITPQNTTEVTPAKLLMGRELKSRLDLLRPNTEVKVDRKQYQQRVQGEKRAMEREFMVGRNFRPGLLWIGGRIIQVTGPVSYLIELDNGNIVRRHAEHIKNETYLISQEPIELFPDAIR